MKNVLEYTLSNLSNIDFKRAERFLNASLVPISRRELALFKAFKEWRERGNSLPPSFEIQYEYVYGVHKPKLSQDCKSKLRKVRHRLSEGILAFNRFEVMESKIYLRELANIEGARKMGDFNFFKKVSTKAFNGIENDSDSVTKYPIKSIINQYLIEESLKGHFSKKESLQSLINSSETTTLNANVLNELRLGLMKMNRSRVVNEGFGSSLKSLIVKGKEINCSIIQMFSRVIECQISSSFSFSDLKSLIEDFLLVQSDFSWSDKNMLVRVLLNEVSIGITKRKREYLSLSLYLIKESLDLKILIEDNQINPRLFLNVVGLCGMLKEYSFLKYFLEKYHHLLPKGNKNSVLNIALAQKSFLENEYPEVLKILSRNSATDKFVKIRTIDLEVRSWYKLALENPNLENVFKDRLKSAYYILGKLEGQQPSFVLRGYKELIRITAQFLKIPTGKVLIEDLRESIENSSTLGYFWLIDELEYLSSKFTSEKLRKQNN